MANRFIYLKSAFQITLRGKRIPAVDCFPQLGKPCDKAFFVILRTPWAKINERVAVAVDELSVGAIFYSPVGTPISPDPSMQFAEFILECWESTDGEPFRFMAWQKMMKND